MIVGSNGTEISDQYAICRVHAPVLAVGLCTADVKADPRILHSPYADLGTMEQKSLPDEFVERFYLTRKRTQHG